MQEYRRRAPRWRLAYEQRRGTAPDLVAAARHGSQLRERGIGGEEMVDIKFGAWFWWTRY